MVAVTHNEFVGLHLPNRLLQRLVKQVIRYRPRSTGLRFNSNSAGGFTIAA
jgi:hypothetical protein